MKTYCASQCSSIDLFQIHNPQSVDNLASVVLSTTKEYHEDSSVWKFRYYSRIKTLFYANKQNYRAFTDHAVVFLNENIVSIKLIITFIKCDYLNSACLVLLPPRGV